jgi:AcrR family transcriptional regulator
MDKRIVNTKKKLTDTFFQLLAKKRINDITVLELCAKADINRTTFYKYYKDIDDLALKIEDDLIADLEKYIVDIKRNYLISFTSKIIEAISHNKDVYTKILSDNGDHTFLRKILNLVHRQSIEEWEKLLKKATPRDLDNIYNFIVDGTIGLIEAWIRNNCQDEPESIAIFINKICMSGLSSFI